MHAICKDDQDDTKICLICCDRAEGDVLLFDELKTLAEKHSDQLTMHVILSHPSDKWQGQKGHLDDDFLKVRLQLRGFKRV